LRFRASVEAVWETAERWGGVIHTDDGNIGRTDVLAGVEATWIVSEDWHVGVQLKVPAYTHIKGGQLDALGFVGLSIGTHTHLFGGDDDDDHDHAPPSDWTGLDKVELTLAAPRTPVVGKITVFDFWATWCKPCGVLDRALAELARKHPGDLAVRKVDVVDEDTPYTLPYVEVFDRDGALLWKRSAPPLQLAADVEVALAGPRAKAPIDPAAPRIVIDITEAGYTPSRLEIPRGTPVTLVFTRRSETTCATDVHFTLPDGSKIAEVLPLATPVEVAVPAQQPGEIHYSCGMNMNHGTIVVK
jgi:thiol-disulfide isomerase/thioredoxin